MKRTLRIGIITSDPEGWHSSRLVAEASKLGRADVLDPLDASVRIGDNGTEVRFGYRRAADFDAIIPRGLHSSGLPDFQLEAYRLLEDEVPVVVNRIGPILTALDKCRTSYLLRQAGLPTPPTLVTQRRREAEAAVERFGDAVLKPLYGSLGEDIVRVQPGRGAREQIERMLSAFGAIYIQRFERPGGRDIRAFVVGDRVVAAIYRVAPTGEWITNVYRGGTAEPINLSPSVEALCVKAAQVVGLDYTGVDVIETSDGPSILEVNGTPSWMGVDEAWHRSMAAEIVGLVVRKVMGLRRTGPAYKATA